MKFKFYLLSITILAAGQALPANAQGMAQEGMSRWNYAPNVWGSKPKSKPKQQPAYIPHSVETNSMPHASAFLGVDPSQLKPQAPATRVQPQTQIAISVPHVQSAPFEKDFGAPINEQQAHPKQMTESSMPAAKSMSSPQVASSSNLSGRLRHPVHSNAQIARAGSLPQIQSYGGNGYTPGAFGAGSSAGPSTNTAVSGVIVSKRH
jgi:hypothetical protein